MAKLIPYDPGTHVFENMIFKTISRHILRKRYFLTILGEGGGAYENLGQETERSFAARRCAYLSFFYAIIVPFYFSLSLPSPFLLSLPSLNTSTQRLSKQYLRLTSESSRLPLTRSCCLQCWRAWQSLPTSSMWSTLTVCSLLSMGS